MGTTPGPNLTGLQTHCSAHVPTRKIRSLCFLKADHPGPLRVPGCHWTKPPARLPPGREDTLRGPFQGSPSTLQVGSLPRCRVPTQRPCSPSPGFPPAALAQACHHRLPPSARPVKSDPSPPASSLALTVAPASSLSLHCPPRRAEIEPSSSSPARYHGDPRPPGSCQPLLPNLHGPTDLRAFAPTVAAAGLTPTHPTER